MIEQRATVVAVDGGYVWVETAPRSDCGQCAARTGCGTSAVAQILGRRRPQVQVTNTFGVGVGDELMLGVDEAAVLRASVAVYLAPLLLMLGGAMLATSVGSDIGVGDEMGAMVGAASGLVLGVGWLRLHARQTRADSRYQPIALRVLGNAGKAGETDKRRVAVPESIINE